MLWQRCSNVEATSWQRWRVMLSQRRKLTSYNSHFRPCHNVVTMSTTTLWQRCHNVAVPAGYEWTDRYYEWTDEYYEWTDKYYEKTSEWTDEYYEWINEYYEWINKYYEYYEWSGDYYEWSDEFYKSYEWQDGICDNNSLGLMSSLMEECKITVLKSTFRKPVFVIFIFIWTFS